MKEVFERKLRKLTVGLSWVTEAFAWIGIVLAVVIVAGIVQEVSSPNGLGMLPGLVGVAGAGFGSGICWVLIRWVRAVRAVVKARG